jgi:hypothetical protein
MQIALEEHDLVDGERRAIDRGLSVDGGKATIANASQRKMCPKAAPLRWKAHGHHTALDPLRQGGEGRTASATTRGLLGEGKTSAPPR